MGRRRYLDNPTLNEAFLELRSDYGAAKQSRYRRRRTGLASMGSHADYHYRSDADYLRIMEYSRDFFRNDPVVGQAIRRLGDNVIGDGFVFDPRTGDGKLDTDLSQRWREWSEDADQCDVMGELAFADMEGHALQGHVVDGDIWALLPDEGAAQLIEAHRVRTPTNAGRRENPPVHGVILDSRRRRLEILVTREDVAPSSAVQRVGDVKRYPIRDRQGQRRVLQVYRADRVTQTRGVSYLAPIFDPIGMHDDIQFAKLVQQQVASCFAIFRMQEELSIESPEATGEITTETLSDGATRTIQGIAPGMEIIGKPGEKLQGFSPTIPNPEFFPHAMLILTFIAINIGIPVAVLLLDPSQTNFSGWRGAIDQARLGFRRLQRLIVRRFHRPMCVWKLRQWAAEDSILGAAAERLGMRFYRHNWHPPGWQYIEPLKDASADLLRVRNALTSQRRRCAERGMDWEDVAREIVEDNSRLIALAFRKAERLNQRFPGLNVTWREVACLPTPDGLTVSVSAGEEGQTAGQRSRQNESEDAHDAG